MAVIQQKHNPSWALFPVNNNCTAWRSFGLPIVLVVPHRRTIDGLPVANSEPLQVRVVIEGSPKEAIVAGYDHVGLRYPNHELYSTSLNNTDLLGRLIPASDMVFFHNGEIIDFEQAIG